MRRTNEILARIDKYLAHNYKPFKSVVSKAEGLWYEDVEGNRILDMLAGYSAANFGHCHPAITETIIEQAQTLVIAPRSIGNNKIDDAGEMLAKLCGKDKILPSNGGVEGFETALKLSLKWGRDCKGISDELKEVIVCRNNFHGQTMAAISASDVDEYKSGFGPLLRFFKWVPFGDPDALGRVITKNTVAFIVEPIQGEGGINIPPDGYLKEVVKICRKRNVLSVFDEIQTGFGRTGFDLAYHYEGDKAEPDILILGKSLGSGLPVSAVAANNQIMQVMTPGIHGSTYGGNPLASAVMVAAINILRDEEMSQKSAEMGAYFISKLREIESPIIKEIRGRGLMIGVELRQMAKPFCEALLREGILCKDTHKNVIRLTPPLVIERDEIDWAMPKFRKVLQGGWVR